MIVGASLLASACASTGATPRPFPVPASDRSRPARPPSIPTVPTSELIDTAVALVGTPYRDGGSTPDGFDCSGFTQWVFARHGLALPRATRDQFEEGTSIKPDQLAPGDLVFFSTVARGPSHVAIVLDADRFVHAPSSNGVVRIEHLSSNYWKRRFVGARRLVPGAE